MGLATIVMVLATLNKPNRFILVLNFMGLKYLSLSEGVFGGPTCWSLSEQTSSSRESGSFGDQKREPGSAVLKALQGLRRGLLASPRSTSPFGAARHQVGRLYTVSYGGSYEFWGGPKEKEEEEGRCCGMPMAGLNCCSALQALLRLQSGNYLSISPRQEAVC